MVIAYLINYNIDDSNGVIQKIKQQAKEWTKNGHIVYFVSLKTMKIYDHDYTVLKQGKSLNLNMKRVGTAINLLFNSFASHKLFKQIDFDIIYMRYHLYMPFINRTLKKEKVIMEINSDDLLEYKLHSKLTHWYNKVTRNLLLKQIDAFVSVSDELKSKFTYLGKPTTVIANGIDAKQYMVNFVNNSVPIFVFIGTPNQPWHGLDKIIKMAEHFKQYNFYIIGTNGKNSKNIQYFGYLSQEGATKIINKCDIGIGTLSLYITGLNEASPLKTRQYLACGLPMIYAYKDTDIPLGAVFALELENKEENIDYDRIEKFVDKVYKNDEIKKEARKFAEDVLDYKIKEQKRLEFFKKVLHAC